LFGRVIMREMMEVRAASAADWRVLRELRLRALADSPEAFATTLEEASSRTEDEWAAATRATAESSDAVSWIVERDGVPIGQAFSRIRGDDSVAGISAMWVAPEGRGLGVAAALIDAAEAWGRSKGCTTVTLFVAEGNDAALRRYEGSGYRPTGFEKPLREGSAISCSELAKPL
jgi:ribosomal protein S18 acetylase RimI-like enzyme